MCYGHRHKYITTYIHKYMYILHLYMYNINIYSCKENKSKYMTQRFFYTHTIKIMLNNAIACVCVCLNKYYMYILL